jgi:arylsulfatase A-like enzyme
MHRVFSVLSLLLLLAACSPAADPSPPSQPNVVVILIDALRADHVGTYGYDRDTSPHIDALASESIVFANANAQSPWTKPSIPTLFTSLYPIQHGVYEGEAHGDGGALESDILDDRFTTLAEAFRERGYRTVGWVNNAHLPASQGFGQGFDTYEQQNFEAEEINRRFFAFLDEGPERPFFAYLHYLDAHWPFHPQPPYRDRFPASKEGTVFAREDWRGLRDRINDGSIRLTAADEAQLVALHDGSLAELDQQIGRLLDELRRRELLDRTAILLTSDHGEELMDHGRVGHGGTLFAEVIEVPLLLRLPGAGVHRVEQSPARLLDVYPTLLGLADIEPPPGLEGRNLLAATNGRPEIIAETRHKRTYQVSVRRGDWKYVRRYKNPGRSHIAADRPESFGLAPGMRVKVDGLFVSDGSLHADKVRIKDPSDDDVEVSGVIAAIDDDREEFELKPFRVELHRKLRGELGDRLPEDLQVGSWVKVEGDVEDDGKLEADKLERLAEDDREVELEGIVAGIEAVDDDEVRLLIGGARVVVTDDTRIKGAEAPPPVAAPPPAAPGEDPFSPQRLLSTEGLEVEESLYDLAKDPREQVDVVAADPDLTQSLRQDLAAWLERMARSPARGTARRESLDTETIEQLRHLGYLE